MERQEILSGSTRDQPASSLTLRITNVFASPSELWTEVAVRPVERSSWLVPYAVSLVVVLVVTFALSNNDALRNQILDAQLEAIRKAVADGRVSQADAERAEEQIRGTGPVLFMLFGGISQLVVVSIMFFGMALVLWLAAKLVLASTAGYMKFLEVTGLATCISILGSIVTLLMMYAFDSLYAAPNLALAVLDHFDVNDTAHKILAQINLFSLWETGVVGLALSKVSGKNVATGMIVAYGLWVIWSVIGHAIGFGFR